MTGPEGVGIRVSFTAFAEPPGLGNGARVNRGVGPARLTRPPARAGFERDIGLFDPEVRGKSRRLR
ncbi:MAG TPA: hypothetical protein VG870_12080 [Chitinophagaceae bacterium]|nr:hypothetical protein [Chitinophagaceae bacterium]